jgi:hypothetical protein
VERSFNDRNTCQPPAASVSQFLQRDPAVTDPARSTLNCALATGN